MFYRVLYHMRDLLWRFYYTDFIAQILLCGLLCEFVLLYAIFILQIFSLLSLYENSSSVMQILLSTNSYVNYFIALLPVR